jgi:hypothetical protein
MAGSGGRGAGLTALFAGDSGTGKTLSAEVVARDLGLDLYVIDLATVVDKYIGETEKNLDRIFSEADRVNGVLLFDEADAIFGKRSEVKDARDRYANVEIAYLLQRMERFDGLAVPTTRSSGGSTSSSTSPCLRRNNASGCGICIFRRRSRGLTTSTSTSWPGRSGFRAGTSGTCASQRHSWRRPTIGPWPWPTWFAERSASTRNSAASRTKRSSGNTWRSWWTPDISATTCRVTPWPAPMCSVTED